MGHFRWTGFVRMPGRHHCHSPCFSLEPSLDAFSLVGSLTPLDDIPLCWQLTLSLALVEFAYHCAKTSTALPPFGLSWEWLSTRSSLWHKYLVRLLHFLSFNSSVDWCFHILSAIEYTPTEKRYLTAVARAIGMGVSGSLLPWVLKYLDDWKLFQNVIFVLPFYVLLSPLWVYMNILQYGAFCL